MIDTIQKWKVGGKVIVNLPFQRRAIGVIQKVTDHSLHVMYNDHEVSFNIDGHFASLYVDAIKMYVTVPKKGELREVLILNRKYELSQIDFYSLTDEQVNDIYKEMKRLAVIF